MLNIYKASAGSGKTFNLAYWYIKLLLGDINPETGQYSLARGRLHSHASILAVTFTNKATQEMKERIIAQLATLAAEPMKSDYISWLKRDLNTDDVEGISQTAREALASILYHFSLFNISTIDSFFQQILRSFAIEVDRPANFTVEMDELLIMDMAVDELFENLDSDKDVREWIRLFMLYKFEQNEAVNVFDKDSGLHAELVSTITGFMTEDYRMNRDLIDGYLKQPERLNRFYNYLTRNVSKVKQRNMKDTEALLKEAEPYNVNKTFLKFLTALAGNGTYKNITGTAAKVAYENPDAAFTGKKDKIPQELKQRMSDVVRYFCDTFDKVRLADLLRRQLFFFGLLGKVTEISERICRDNNIILLSNTNELINKIIGKNPVISPFIYERVGSRLHNFLMDEFQDTSALQWLNMKPLLLESLSAGNDNLIIGDEKQCIYRFRNSSPELLSFKVREQMEYETEIDERGNRIEENTNWRSTPEVIRFNNTLFYTMGQEIEPGSAYSHVMQGISNKNKDDRGHVSVRFFNTESFNTSSDGEGEGGKKKLTAKELESHILDELIIELKRLLGHYSPGEIAILVEKNKHGEKIIARMLEAMEPQEGSSPELPRFEIVSNDALRVSSASSVKMLVNQLRLSESPGKDDEKGEEPKPGSQWVKRTSSDFATLEHKFEQYYSDFRDIKSSAAGRALANALYDDVLPVNILTKATAGHQCNDLVSIVERLIGELPSKMKEEETIFITAFQDLVMSYSDRGNGDIRGFLSWWDKIGVKAKINSPENKTALTVSTIHKSKGLEYPCVIIPFANWVFQEDSAQSKTFFNWYAIPENIFDEEVDFAPAMLPLKKEKRLSETLLRDQYEQINRQQHIDALNLTYVAFTRAKRELVVFVQEPRANKEYGLAAYMRKAFETDHSSIITRIDSLNEGADRATLDLLHDSVMDFSNVFNPDEQRLEYGATNRRDITMSKEKRSLEAPAENNQEQYGNAKHMTDSELMPVYKARDNERTLKFMHLTDEDDYDPENARQKGVYMHYVLSKVAHPSSLRYACLVRGQKINMLPQVINERYKQLKEAIDYPPVKKWFYDFRRVLTERDFWDTDRREHYRPDRVVWTADGYIDVVDFKFGDSRNFERYERQVQRYVDKLRQAGYKKVRGFLWYPLDSFIHTVDDDDHQSLV